MTADPSLLCIAKLRANMAAILALNRSLSSSRHRDIGSVSRSAAFLPCRPKRDRAAVHDSSAYEMKYLMCQNQNRPKKCRKMALRWELSTALLGPDHFQNSTPQEFERSLRTPRGFWVPCVSSASATRPTLPSSLPASPNFLPFSLHPSPPPFLPPSLLPSLPPSLPFSLSPSLLPSFPV